MGALRNLGGRPKKKNSPPRRAHFLEDKLLHALFVHHRSMFPRSMERRLLPMCTVPSDEIVVVNDLPKRREQPVICLPDLSHLPPPQPVYRKRSATAIIEEVLERRCIPASQFFSPCRLPHVIAARQEICWRIAEHSDMSLKDIGRLLNKDHTTVMNSIMRWCDDRGIPLPRGRVWKRRNTGYAPRNPRVPLRREPAPALAE